MASFLHTMVRITDAEKSRAFYEALGFRFERDMDIVRDGQLEATNYYYSIGDAENVLELTFNHDGRTYDLGTGYGHIAIGAEDLDGALARLSEQGIEPERPPYQVSEGGNRLCFVRDPEQSQRVRTDFCDLDGVEVRARCGSPRIENAGCRPVPGEDPGEGVPAVDRREEANAVAA